MKTLFLDFGNVVAFFDHQRAIRQLVDYTPLNEQDLTRILYGSSLEFDYETGKLSTEEYVREALVAGQLRCSEVHFLQSFVDIFTPNPAVCELIPKLATRYRLVLASNTNAAHYQHYCQQFAQELKSFAALCPSHLVGWRKPHPDYFLQCQIVAHAEPNECLFLDDLTVNIEAAHRHGWNTIHYRPDTNLIEQLNSFGITLS